MPLFHVTEEYPQATVRRVLVVDAESSEAAYVDPHASVVDRKPYEVDEGDEARTAGVRPAPVFNNPSGNHYYRQLVVVEILSEGPVDEHEFDDLDAMNYAITTGDCSGIVSMTEQEEVSAEEMCRLLERQASDPSFLVADEDIPEADRDEEDEEDADTDVDEEPTGPVA